MSLEGIQTVLFEVLKEVQTLCGHEWEDLPPSAIPLNILPGFDSLCAVEATVMVEEKLGRGQLSKESFFISEDGKRPLSIQESAQLIEKLLQQGRG